MITVDDLRQLGWQWWGKEPKDRLAVMAKLNEWKDEPKENKYTELVYEMFLAHVTESLDPGYWSQKGTEFQTKVEAALRHAGWNIKRIHWSDYLASKDSKNAVIEVKLSEAHFAKAVGQLLLAKTEYGFDCPLYIVTKGAINKRNTALAMKLGITAVSLEDLV